LQYLVDRGTHWFPRVNFLTGRFPQQQLNRRDAVHYLSSLFRDMPVPAGGAGLDALDELPLRIQGLERRYLMNMMYCPRDVENTPNPGLRAASTAHIRYRIDPGLGITEDEINARVRRIHDAKDARSPSANPVYAERTGRLTVPLITLHETGER
jgi:hypothetical protein